MKLPTQAEVDSFGALLTTKLSALPPSDVEERRAEQKSLVNLLKNSTNFNELLMHEASFGPFYDPHAAARLCVFAYIGYKLRDSLAQREELEAMIR